MCQRTKLFVRKTSICKAVCYPILHCFFSSILQQQNIFIPSLIDKPGVLSNVFPGPLLNHGNG